jgi:hypothetical protein
MSHAEHILPLLEICTSRKYLGNCERTADISCSVMQESCARQTSAESIPPYVILSHPEVEASHLKTHISLLLYVREFFLEGAGHNLLNEVPCLLVVHAVLHSIGHLQYPLYVAEQFALVAADETQANFERCSHACNSVCSSSTVSGSTLGNVDTLGPSYSRSACCGTTVRSACCIKLSCCANVILHACCSHTMWPQRHLPYPVSICALVFLSVSRAIAK